METATATGGAVTGRLPCGPAFRATWITTREVWAARHTKTPGQRRLAGAIALVKWAVQDAQAWRVIEQAIKKKKSKD